MSKADKNKTNNFSSPGADYSEATLRDLLTQDGLSPGLTERTIKDYQRHKGSDLSSLSLLTVDDIREIGAEALEDKVRELRIEGKLVGESLGLYLNYLGFKKQIIETYQESKDWGDVYSTSVYSDVTEAQEAFIDYIEEIHQTKVKDVKHLIELTGITHLQSWDSSTRKYFDPETEGEAKENATRELEETLTSSRYNKYFRSLERTLQEGGKYKDLLQIDPQDFGLPESWSGCLGSDQYSSILLALSYEFLIDEPGGLMMLPGLRSIAQEVEAPYSVLMDSYNIARIGQQFRMQLQMLQERLKKAVRAHVKNQPKEWRDDHLFNPMGEWTEEDAKRVEDEYINIYPYIYFSLVLFNEIFPERSPSEMEKGIIEAHREDIIKYYKRYLDEGIKIVEGSKEKAQNISIRRSILINHFLWLST